MLRGAEWRRHPGRGRPARLGPTEPSAVASPGLGGVAVAAPGPLGTQRGGERPGCAPGRAGGSAGDDNAGGLRAGLPAGGTASSGEAGRALR